MLMKWNAAGASDQGKKRSENQDCFICDKESGLYAVSDGMGGVVFGKETAEMVIRLLAESCKNCSDNVEQEAVCGKLKEQIVEISSRIREQGNLQNRGALYGATLTGFFFYQKSAIVFNVGDSRVYCLRKGKKLIPLTEDDSLIQLFLNAGVKLDERKRKGLQGRITQFMGRYETIQPFVLPYELQEGDILCACSDGLNNMVTDSDIEEVLKGNESPDDKVRRLIAMANDAGGNDNITVIVCEIEKSTEMTIDREKKQMKILSITAQKPDSTGSGVYLTELVKGFQKMGHEQAVIAGVTKEDMIQLPERVEVYPVYYQSEKLPFPVAGMSDEMPYESTRYSDMTENMTNQFRETFCKHVKEIVQKFQPDVILCHHLYYLTSLVREVCPDIKVCGISHGSDLRQIQKNPWQREYIKQQICCLDQIFALHQEQKEDSCRYYGCSKEMIEVIGTGYNSDVFYLASEEKEQREKQRIIFAGKISEKKGVMSLLKSISYIPDAKNKIEIALAGGYGNSEEYEEICRLAKECPCEVTFLGKLPQARLAQELNQSDIFILPSFFEGLPLVIIEAMACGLRVVCTDLPGIQNWLAANIPNNGVVFVEPPKMRNADEPIPESLPDFEKRLANAIVEVQKQKKPEQEAIQKISWDGLCEKLNRHF